MLTLFSNRMFSTVFETFLSSISPSHGSGPVTVCCHGGGFPLLTDQAAAGQGELSSGPPFLFQSKSVQSRRHASEDPANHCTSGQRGHVRPVKSLWGYARQTGEWAKGTLSFMGYWGESASISRLIEVSPAWRLSQPGGRDMVHLGSAWRRGLTPSHLKPAFSHTVPISTLIPVSVPSAHETPVLFGPTVFKMWGWRGERRGFALSVITDGSITLSFRFRVACILIISNVQHE